MAKIKKYEKDGEVQRIDLTVSDKELWEAGRKTADAIDSKNEKLLSAYEKALKLAGGASPSMFVEPVDENTSRCYVIGKDGKRIDLGEIPTFEALEKAGKIRFSEAEKYLKKWQQEQIERNKLLMDSLGALDVARWKSAVESISEQMRPAMDTLKEWGNYTAKLFEDFGDKSYFKGVSEMLSAIQVALSKNPAFSHYADELEKLSQLPEYKDADIFRPGLDYEDEAETIPADTLHNKALLLAMENARAAIAEAKQKAQEAQDTQEKQDNEEKHPVIKAQRKDSPATIIPIDKINNTIWKMIERVTPNGQMMYEFVTGKPIKKGQRDINPFVTYSLDFDKIEKAAPETAQIVKHLTPYDKRVMVAVAALYNAGNHYFTITDIWHKMGNAQEKRPNKNDFDKINNSLKKQSYAHLVLNNLGEQKVDYNYPKFHYEGELLQFEKVTAEIDGQPIESAIHLFREPPLIAFARDRKQITTVNNAVLESPINKTEQNLQIDDYLIERIAAMNRDPKISRKILYKSLFDDCGINRNQSRAKETIERYLKHYKATEFIQDFQAQGDFIIITP